MSTLIGGMCSICCDMALVLAAMHLYYVINIYIISFNDLYIIYNVLSVLMKGSFDDFITSEILVQ